MTAYPNREKFTVADVERNEQLYMAAVNYARNYRGDFAFLRNARDTVEGLGRLPEYIAKGVLNCMLVDPTVVFPDTVSSAPPQLALVELPVAQVIPIRSHLDVNARVKKTWITSTERGAQVSHLIDPDRFTAVWIRYRNEINFTVITRCGVRWQSMRYAKYMSNPGRILSDLPRMARCRTCQAKADKIEEAG